MLRINKDFYLAKEIPIKSLFKYPNGEKVEVVSIFQIWTKIFSKNVKPILPPEKKFDWIKVYSISNGKTSSSKRNINMIGKCDYYLPSTTYKKINLEKNFDKLPHNRGYGVKIKKDIKIISSIFESIDWNEKSFKSTNNANNLRTQIIIDEINKEKNKYDN